MTNKSKIIVGILIILAIIVLIFGIVSSRLKKINKNNEKDKIDNMMEYFEETHEKDNYTDNDENNILVENSIPEKKETENNTQSNYNTIAKQEVIGKEENESNNENTELDNEKIAIELAKKEWGISIDSYDFQVKEVKNDGTYDIKVVNKTDSRVITIYNVNIKTGVVIE